MGGRIRAERERAGLTQAKLGELIGVTQQSVGKWESKGNVSAKRLEAIAQVLQVPVAHLLGPINEVEIDAQLRQLRDLGDAASARFADLFEMLEPVNQSLRLHANPENLECALDAARSVRKILFDAAYAIQETRKGLHQLGIHSFDEPLEQLRRQSLDAFTEQVAPLVDAIEETLASWDEQPAELLAAHGADPEAQTVEPVGRPGADAPEEQEPNT